MPLESFTKPQKKNKNSNTNALAHETAKMEMDCRHLQMTKNSFFHPSIKMIKLAIFPLFIWANSPEST